MGFISVTTPFIEGGELDDLGLVHANKSFSIAVTQLFHSQQRKERPRVLDRAHDEATAVGQGKERDGHGSGRIQVLSINPI